MAKQIFETTAHVRSWACFPTVSHPHVSHLLLGINTVEFGRQVASKGRNHWGRGSCCSLWYLCHLVSLGTFPRTPRCTWNNHATSLLSTGASRHSGLYTQVNTLNSILYIRPRSDLLKGRTTTTKSHKLRSPLLLTHKKCAVSQSEKAH